MKYLKTPNNKTYIQWNVTSGSGFFSMATKNNELYPSLSSVGLCKTEFLF